MTKRTVSKILAGLLAGSMLLAGCTTTGGGGTASTPAPSDGATSAPAEGGEEAPPAESGDKKVLRLNNSSEPGSFHPGLAQGTHDSWGIDGMFEGLYAKDPNDGPPIFAAAESAETSEDGKTWTFKINPAAMWSNGDPVTAHDFVASYHFTIDPVNAANYSSQLYILENAEAINAGEITDLNELGAKALDDSTLELKLVNPLPYLPDLLTHYTFRPIHKANAEAHPDWYVTPENFICNGAFTLKEWKNKESFTLAKNPLYRLAADVKLDEIYFTIIEDATTAWQMYQNNELDAVYPLLPAVIEQLRNEGNAELHSLGELSVYYYMINNNKPGLNNVKVRQALSQAIDRQAIVDNVTKGGQLPATTLTPPGISDGTGDFQESLGSQFEFSAENAKILLAEGLAEEGLSEADFKPTILYNTDETHKKVAEAIQAMWIQGLGIQAGLENAEFQVVLDRRDGRDYDICRAGWVGDYSDPMTFLELLTSWSEFNQADWHSDPYDEQIRIAQGSMDNDVRMNAMKEAEKIAAEGQGFMPIYFYSANWTIKPNVSGWYKPVNRYVQFYYADIA